MTHANSCKYILHFKENSIISTRIETQDPQEILLYVSEVFAELTETQVCQMFDIGVFSSAYSESVNANNFYLGIVPTNVKIKTGDIVCKLNYLALQKLIEGSKEFILPVQPLSVDEIESFFNSSVVGFKKISTVDWFAKNLGIKVQMEVN
ncbi:MAG: hypothetical protein HC874_07315 [Richelia sp. SL_2_1]|nr:hypothetical protein [Richelia sp. SL_2_1]